MSCRVTSWNMLFRNSLPISVRSLTGRQVAAKDVVVEYEPKHRSDRRAALRVYGDHIQIFRKRLWRIKCICAYRCVLRGTVRPADGIPTRPSRYSQYRACTKNASTMFFEACSNLVSLTKLDVRLASLILCFRCRKVFHCREGRLYGTIVIYWKSQCFPKRGVAVAFGSAKRGAMISRNVILPVTLIASRG